MNWSQVCRRSTGQHLELDEQEIVLAMIEHPRLMERPIIVKGNKAVVARPADAMDAIL